MINLPDISYFYIDAIRELSPNLKFKAKITESGILDYDNIEIDEGTGVLPSLNKIIVKSEEIKNKSIQNQYIGLRRREYPLMSEFLDAWVKNDTDALELYRQKCLDIKSKYPKPE